MNLQTTAAPTSQSLADDGWDDDEGVDNNGSCSAIDVEVEVLVAPVVVVVVVVIALYKVRISMIKHPPMNNQQP